VDEVYRSDDPDPAAAASARHATERWLAEHGVSVDERPEVLLAVSELVTNAIRHARTSFVVWADADDHVVRIEIFDRDSRLPILLGADENATSGRGMQIVAAVADEWGARTGAREGIEGKLVWATFGVETR
jgi:anti-sigma regulatory factor (Ser/Thr protein kinase)